MGRHAKTNQQPNTLPPKPTWEEVLQRLGENPSQEDLAIAKGLHDGKKASHVRKELRVGTCKIAAVEHRIGWETNWRILKRKESKGRPRPEIGLKTIGTRKLSVETAYALYVTDNWTLAKIGRIAGVSRERIRQVILTLDHTAPTQKREKRQKINTEKTALHKKEVVERRIKKTLATYKEHRELWEQGLAVSEIAAKLGHTTNALNTTICRLRARHGWFPYRHAYQRHAKSPPTTNPHPSQHPQTSEGILSRPSRTPRK